MTDQRGRGDREMGGDRDRRREALSDRGIRSYVALVRCESHVTATPIDSAAPVFEIVCLAIDDCSLQYRRF